MSGLQPWGDPNPSFGFCGGREKVVGYVTSQIRRFRPDVVVTLPVDGANGNPQHCAASKSAVLAFESAGMKQAFPKQLETLEPWTPKKLYLRVSEEEFSDGKYKTMHDHSWNEVVPGSGETARTIAARANAQHISQEMKNECDALTRFVLLNDVSLDKVGKNNLFEGIE
jgi:LmbE family N-acetylglucosaminyl deacetylase